MPSIGHHSPRVYLIGAGPGDPGLLTLRAAECLRNADVVLYDYLVNPRILEHARAGAELVSLGRHGTAGQGGDRLVQQSEINRLMVERALAGKRVARLKGGDPAVFGHLAEELEALNQAGIAYEIVPGITAALAASSHAGIPITHGETASALAIVTGQERCGKPDTALDYAALAKFPGTLVFYMGITTVRDWTSALVAAGKPADTPAAIVRRCSWPDQKTICCTLGEVAGQIESQRLRPPVIVVVGDVAQAATERNWFVDRPLFGQRVMVTRPSGRDDTLAQSLRELGAEVLVQPAIEIGPPDDWTPVDAALANLHDFDWVVFSSARGVQALAERLLETGRDLRAFGKARIAAIGPGTGEELLQYHLRADLIPDEYRAETLAEALSVNATRKRMLLVRASRGRDVLAQVLKNAGVSVVEVVAYSSTDVVTPRPETKSAMEAGTVDWITVTSSAIARSLTTLFGEQLKQCKLVSISPITSATLISCGYPPTAEAREYTMRGIVEAILEHEAGKTSATA